MSPVRRPKRSEVLVFATPLDFRDWLEEHHATTPEAFIGYYKKGVDRKAMTYAEAVDEALCYGWIDGITYRVDDEMTTTRFTPRRKGSNWSAVNIAKVGRLTAEGRMRPAGLRAFEARDAGTVGAVLLRASPGGTAARVPRSARRERCRRTPIGRAAARRTAAPSRGGW